MDAQAKDSRLARIQHKVPLWFVPIHLGVTLGILSGISAALLFFRPSKELTLEALWAAIFVVLLLDFIEYSLHRWPMHKRKRWSRSFFRHHTIGHHRYFTSSSMGIEKWPDLYFVISSTPVIIISIIILLGVTCCLSFLMGANVGMFAGGVLGVYATFKQILHVTFHFPDEWLKSFIFQNSLFKAMKEHHTIHHNPHLMRKWNFNVGVPLFDYLFRTVTWKDPSSNSTY